MPDFTIASAMPRTSSSLTLHANLFQVFQPMGGVSARPLETDVSCANATQERSTTGSHRLIMVASIKHTFVSERPIRLKSEEPLTAKAAKFSQGAKGTRIPSSQTLRRLCEL